MKSFTLVAIATFSSAIASSAHAQQYTGTAKWADSASRAIEAANAAGDLNGLTGVAAMIDRVLTVAPNDQLLHYYRALALRSSVIGLMIGLSGNPLSGMTLGPKSSGLLDRAKELEPKNPRVWLISGMSAMFTPKMFGGGTDKAEADLRKAIGLFETDRPAGPAPSWGRADAYVWLGRTLQKEDKTADAKVAYEKALEIQPDYQWVRRVLLPSLSAAKE